MVLAIFIEYLKRLRKNNIKGHATYFKGSIKGERTGKDLKFLF